MSIRNLLLAKFLICFIYLYSSGAHASALASELADPIRQYRGYVLENLQGLVTSTDAFTAAVKAGRIEDAKRLYAPSRAWYERIEPIADLFSDLDAAIDSRADDHEGAEKDPDFGGFHRIEYALWIERDTRNIEQVADRLLEDVQELQKRVEDIALPPEKVVSGAAVLMEEVAATKISGEENRYSHTDLWDIQANCEGAYKIVELLRPLIISKNKAVSDRINRNFISVFAVLNTYRTPGKEFQSYTNLQTSDRKALAGRVNTLAEDLSTLPGTLSVK